MPKLDQFFRIQEAADYLEVCRNTLRNWCRQGKNPEFRHSVHNWLFLAADLDALLRETEQAVNGPDSGPTPRRPR